MTTQRSRHTVHGLDWLHGTKDRELKGERTWHAELLGIDAEVEYRRADYEHGEDPGWYLYCRQLGYFGKYLAHTRDEALELATNVVIFEKAVQ